MAERRPAAAAPPAKKAKREKVGVGVGVVVTKGRPRVANGTVSDFRILVGLRKGSHGAGQWALPGGWLEKGEEFLDCALRELREETGIAPSDSDLPTRGESKARAAGTLPFVANNTQMDGVHSVTVFCYVKLKDARTEARVEEPDKCEEWRWCSREEVSNEIAKHFGAVPGFVDSLLADEIGDKLPKKMKEILDNQSDTLKLELACQLDLEPIIKTCYSLEGDGLEVNMRNM